MKIKKEVYERFYEIFQDVFMDVEFPNQVWRETTAKKSSPMHWEITPAGAEEPLSKILTKKEDRFYYRFLKDYRTYKVSFKDMPDEIAIRTMRWLGSFLSPKIISTYGLKENQIAPILFQFFWELYDSQFLKKHPELTVIVVSDDLTTLNFKEQDSGLGVNNQRRLHLPKSNGSSGTEDENSTAGVEEAIKHLIKRLYDLLKKKDFDEAH